MKTYLLLLILLSASAHAEWEPIFHQAYEVASDGESLYADTEDGIYYSRDDGDTWRQSNVKQPVEILAAFPEAVFAFASDDGILRSVTGGNTWHPANNGFEAVWNGRRFVYPYVRQFLVTRSGMVIAVGYHSGTHVSRDYGDSWHAVTDEWIASQGENLTDILVGDGIWSMGEFDGHLWALYSSALAVRSPDEGASWKTIPIWGHGRTIRQFSRVNAWLTFRDNLYVAGGGGFGRGREEGLEWEDLSRGLPHNRALNSLVVHRNRMFAGSSSHGVFMFDHHSEVWHPAGLSSAYGLVSHCGHLYAATDGHIYRTDGPFVTSEGKAAVTWGAMKLDK